MTTSAYGTKRAFVFGCFARFKLCLFGKDSVDGQTKVAEELIYHLLEPVALLTLELLGKKAALGRVFNESEFRKIRNQCIAHILVSAGRHSLNREVRELMETTGFRPSMWHRLRAVSTLQFFTQHLCRELGLRSLHYTERSQAFG